MYYSFLREPPLLSEVDLAVWFPPLLLVEDITTPWEEHCLGITDPETLQEVDQTRIILRVDHMHI